MSQDIADPIPSTFRIWWAMIEAEYQIDGQVLSDDDIALNYMGCGASCSVTVGEIRAMLSATQNKVG